MLSLGARIIILRWYPFSLHLALSFGVRSFNLRDWSLCYLWELTLLSWDDTHLVYAWRSHLRFPHSICVIDLCALFGSSHYYLKMIPIQFAHGTLIWGSLIQSTQLIIALFLGAHAIILRWYLFILRLALSSRVRPFNLHDWLSCSLWELVHQILNF